jgi:nucleotide-binding universal stress UspA family protein
MLIIKPYQTILVPLDGSENSQIALAHAIYLAEQCHAAISLLHVVNLSSVFALSPYEQSNYVLMKDVQDSLEEIGKKVLSEAASKIPAVIKTHSSLEFGSPGHIIVETAEKLKADLIVMGSRGLGPVKGLFMGSISNYVTGHSPIPVFIVRSV